MTAPATHVDDPVTQPPQHSWLRRAVSVSFRFVNDGLRWIAQVWRESAADALPDSSTPAAPPAPTSHAEATVADPWRSVTDAQEAAARAAIAGIELDGLLRDEDDTYVAAAGHLNRRRALLAAAEDAECTRLTKLAADAEEKLRALRAERDSLAVEARTRARLESAAGFEVAAVARSARAARRELQRKHELDEDLHRRQRELDDIRHALATAHERSQAAIADRAVNARLYADAAAAAAAELSELERLLKDARALAHSLQQRGLTRAVARFLKWATFTSIGALGLLLAFTLQPHVPGADASQDPFIRLQQLLGADGANANLYLSLIQYLAVVGVMFLAVAGSVLGAFAVLRAANGSRRPHASARQRWQGAALEDIGSWMNFFGIGTPGFGPRVQAVDQNTLLQLIYGLPVVLAVSLVAFVWIVTATPATQAASPSFNLAYVGVCCGLLAASTGLLFWIFVLRPTLEGETVSSGPGAFYTASFALPVLTPLVLSAISPAPDTYGIAVVAVGFLSGAIGLGHATYLSGVFAREEYLERECAKVQSSIEDNSREPTAFQYAPKAGAKAARPKRADRAPRRLSVLRIWRYIRGTRTVDSTSQASSATAVDPFLSADVPAEMVPQANEAGRQYVAARSAHSEAVAAQHDAEMRLTLAESAHRAHLAALSAALDHRVAVLDSNAADEIRLLAGYRHTRAAISEAYFLTLTRLRNAPQVRRAPTPHSSADHA